MFKKRNIQKKTDLNKDLEDIQIVKQRQQDSQKHQVQKTVAKSIQTKKINKFSNQTKKQEIPSEEKGKQKKPNIVKYGLIDQEQVNSKFHSNIETQQQRQPQKHSIVNLYVKRKMQQLAGIKQEVNEKKDANTQQIIQMQKKYLQLGQEKLAQYDISEILKRLQNMATNSIKSQIQNRNNYLKNLLENEHEKMQYASKKQLKVIRQQKQRVQNQFHNKYNDSGRRGYVQKMKYQSMFNK